MYTTVYALLCVYECVWELLEALLAHGSASHDGSAEDYFSLYAF